MVFWLSLFDKPSQSLNFKRIFKLRNDFELFQGALEYLKDLFSLLREEKFKTNQAYLTCLKLHGKLCQINNNNNNNNNNILFLYFFVFTWEDYKFTWTVTPQVYMGESHLLSQILKADLDDVNFPRDSTLIQYVDNLVYTIGNYFGYLICNNELLINRERPRGILSFPLPKIRKQLRGFLGLTGHCHS